MKSVYVNGITGNMGRLAVEVIENEPSLDLAGGANNTQDMKKGIMSSQPDIIIDVTRSDVVMAHMQWLIQQRKYLLVGTSGITEQDKQQIESWCKIYKSTCWLVPNFSIGAILMMKFASIAAEYFEKAEIIERHHSRKVDAPSQTAKQTALALEAQDVKTHIVSIREDQYQAEQAVLLNNPNESICIEHKSFNHHSYASGIRYCLKTISALSGYQFGINLKIN